MEQARYSSYRQNVALGPPKPQEVTLPCKPSHSDDPHTVMQGDKDRSCGYGAHVPCLCPSPSFGLSLLHVCLRGPRERCVGPRTPEHTPPCCSRAAGAGPQRRSSTPRTSGSCGKGSCSSSSGSKWRSSSKCSRLRRPRKRRPGVCARPGGGRGSGCARGRGRWSPDPVRVGEAPARTQDFPRVTEIQIVPLCGPFPHF